MLGSARGQRVDSGSGLGSESTSLLLGGTTPGERKGERNDILESDGETLFWGISRKAIRFSDFGWLVKGKEFISPSFWDEGGVSF